MRKDIAALKKKKEKELQEKNPFSEFSFDQENSEGFEANQSLGVKCVQALKTDVKSLQVEMESV